MWSCFSKQVVLYEYGFLEQMLHLQQRKMEAERERGGDVKCSKVVLVILYLTVQYLQQGRDVSAPAPPPSSGLERVARKALATAAILNGQRVERRGALQRGGSQKNIKNKLRPPVKVRIQLGWYEFIILNSRLLQISPQQKTAFLDQCCKERMGRSLCLFIIPVRSYDVFV